MVNNQFDLAVLDITLPDIDGFQMTKKTREKYFFLTILLTTKTEDTGKITGLTSGADDYIIKPFDPLEVVARIKTQLRRFRKYNSQASLQQETEGTEIDIHSLVINKIHHTSKLYGEDIFLTPLKFSILWYLAGRQGEVVPAEILFEEI